MASSLARTAALIQGGYFVLSGVWPLVSMKTFLRVTGPKTDLWLVKTVGVLVTAVGASLLLAGRRERTEAETALLGVGSALGLAAVDVVYVSRRRIGPVYLLDAVAEAGLIGLWALALARRDGSPE